MIRINPSKRIDETIEGMPDLQKTMFAGVLFDYISLNLETYINKSQNLFEKPREVRDDWIMKFNLIETYN